jgi:hypothetical protein
MSKITLKHRTPDNTPHNRNLNREKKIDNEIKRIWINKIKWLTVSHDYLSGMRENKKSTM